MERSFAAPVPMHRESAAHSAALDHLGYTFTRGIKAVFPICKSLRWAIFPE
jgi:hypothetical protein